jgi:hypothetical protein
VKLNPLREVTQMRVTDEFMLESVRMNLSRLNSNDREPAPKPVEILRIRGGWKISFDVEKNQQAVK